MTYVLYRANLARDAPPTSWVTEQCGSDGLRHLLSTAHGLGALAVLQSGYADNCEKASAGVIASPDLSSFLRPFARDKLPTVQAPSAPDEMSRAQFLADLQITRRAMLAAFGSILTVAQDLDKVKPTSAETITLPVRLLNRNHLYCQVSGHGRRVSAQPRLRTADR